MLEYLITHYGYPFLIIGAFLEGETVLVLAGLAAQLGYLSLDWVIACGFAGTALGDQFYFSLGHFQGKNLLKRKPSWQSGATRVFKSLERHQNLLIIGFRFLYGVRVITPFAIGMSNVRYPRFLLLSLIGTTVWVITFSLIGYYFGRAAEDIMGNIKHYELALMLSVISVTGVVWIVQYYFRRRHNRAD